MFEHIVTCTKKSYKPGPEQTGKGLERNHKPIWAGSGTGNKSLLSNPAACAAVSIVWLGMRRWVPCLLLPHPQRPRVSGLELYRHTYQLGDRPTTAAHALCQSPSVPGIEPRRPAPHPLQPGSQKQNPASISATTHTTLPPTQESRPQTPT